MAVIWPGVAIVLPRLAAAESFSGGGGGKGQSVRGWEVFVRRVRQSAAGGMSAGDGGGGGVAVVRLGGRMGRWEWWSGVIEAAVVVIRSRPGVASAGVCIPGSLLPEPAGLLACLAQGPRRSGPTNIRPITRGQITSYHSTVSTKELLRDTTFDVVLAIWRTRHSLHAQETRYAGATRELVLVVAKYVCCVHVGSRSHHILQTRHVCATMSCCN